MVQDCPNGKLTPNTFCEMYKMFFPAGDAEKFCVYSFRTFDADKSGTIDFKVGKSNKSETGWCSTQLQIYFDKVLCASDGKSSFGYIHILKCIICV